MPELVLPLGPYSIEKDSIKLSNDVNRSFIIFGEELPLFITSSTPLVDRLQSLRVDLKEASLVIDENTNEFIKHNDNVWEVNPSFIKNSVFNSDYLLSNNGQQGRIKFTLKYKKNHTNSNSSIKSYEEDTDGFLPSFKPLNDHDVTPSAYLEKQEQPDYNIIIVEYPMFSLMNMRLRNVSIRSNRNSNTTQVISSLDLQLVRKFGDLFPGERHVVVEDLSYKLCDGNFEFEIKPLEEMIQFPLQVKRQDAYTINYNLQDSSRQVKVTIIYTIGSHYRIHTSWKTEVCLGRSAPSKSVVSSNASTPTFIQPPKVQLPRVLTQAHFTFLQSKIKAKKGHPFTLSLQIENTTARTLNLVVYHKPKTPLAQTVVLISNDLKLPLLFPGTTFKCDLELIAISTGYHHHMKGLKILDLDALETIDLGVSLSLLIE
ncbi:Beta-glucan synthesis-associated protein KRE11 [Kluyveromyces marxianus]